METTIAEATSSGRPFLGSRGQWLSRGLALVLATALLAGACSSSDDETTVADTSGATSEPTGARVAEEPTTVPIVDGIDAQDPAEASSEPTEPAVEPSEEVTQEPLEEPSGVTATLVAEVWADNWFALYVNGVLVGEDSVSITTERSFNAETITFEATYPLTIAIEAKDFKETDSGIEYIGLNNQQMGDGGLIVQITDQSTGQVVAVSNASWSTLVVHQAPLNTSCEKDVDPDATCEFLITETPADWTMSTFDDSAWTAATEWSEADVSPKDGYDQISWDATASLVWGADLEVDNTVLLRLVVAG